MARLLLLGDVNLMNVTDHAVPFRRVAEVVTDGLTEERHRRGAVCVGRKRHGVLAKRPEGGPQGGVYRAKVPMTAGVGNGADV